MNFQTEYEILTSLNSDQILEIAFQFNNHRIKVFFTKRENQEFFILVCANEQFSFVKNYGIYFNKNNTAFLGGHMGEYYPYAKGLTNEKDGRFTEFYDKLKQAIQSIQNPNEEFSIKHLNPTEGIQKITDAQKKSKRPKDKIYFYRIARTNMQDIHFEKIEKILGKEAAHHLRNSGLNAHFTDDIARQKTFILKETKK
ncbi:hypothetical protein P9B03_02310 [Metasolibacillus meyeri]|uniref:Uncharacterized protein n=1 Tax=Metasolibacillus meyeri TaxID=1071052 RepID=A0AAW9NFM2_9BACL|nr:hypothetical protein [Metasolibacillus meyeri]MEC1177304.1 hypothetical protein [Metasolibacillus meyeri]